ncbi:MAG: hypothetical protein CML02_04880 [Pseudooceanicola sp.]|nr:hypothetical protein [Pseudooceanicola sp.]
MASGGDIYGLKETGDSFPLSLFQKILRGSPAQPGGGRAPFFLIAASRRRGQSPLFLGVQIL